MADDETDDRPQYSGREGGSLERELETVDGDEDEDKGEGEGEGAANEKRRNPTRSEIAIAGC